MGECCSSLKECHLDLCCCCTASQKAKLKSRDIDAWLWDNCLQNEAAPWSTEQNRPKTGGIYQPNKYPLLSCSKMHQRAEILQIPSPYTQINNYLFSSILKLWRYPLDDEYVVKASLSPHNLIRPPSRKNARPHDSETHTIPWNDTFTLRETLMQSYYGSILPSDMPVFFQRVRAYPKKGLGKKVLRPFRTRAPRARETGILHPIELN